MLDRVSCLFPRALCQSQSPKPSEDSHGLTDPLGGAGGQRVATPTAGLGSGHPNEGPWGGEGVLGEG